MRILHKYACVFDKGASSRKKIVKISDNLSMKECLILTPVVCPHLSDAVGVFYEVQDAYQIREIASENMKAPLMKHHPDAIPMPWIIIQRFL
ncbi:MAG: hypothetical protein K0M58_05950 [Thiobacillus sp.]|nr:hypothetical protein [Thiobacillus sp.]